MSSTLGVTTSRPPGATALLSLFLAAAPASAFHEQGVARCAGCHVTHDLANVAAGPDGEALLLAETPSDLCLQCHSGSSSISVLGSDALAPLPQRGGGDFTFLLENNLNDAPEGLSDPIPGDAAGHNLLAPGQGLVTDPGYSLSPGGSFPASSLGCTSCHDPHGRTEFRMLWGAGPVQGGAFTFSFAAPQATGISLSTSEDRNNHTAYRSGMSDWCGNCHGRYHDSGDIGFEHPSDDELDAEIADWYNGYDGDANPTGGSFGSAYLPEVPFEGGATSTSSTNGPGTGSRVMCLTCHRAHASSGPHAGRWDFNVTLLADDGVVSGSYRLPNPYLDPDQGRLCTKCHEGGAP